MRNQNGFSLLEVMIAGLVGAISIGSYIVYSNYQYRATRNIDSKLMAEHSASELLEFFRAMKTDGVTKYLAAKNLPLCKPINYPDTSTVLGVQFSDSAANPVGLDSLGTPLYRGYQISTVDIKTMQPSTSCTTPSGSERYLVKAVVKWKADSVVLSTVIPQEGAPLPPVTTSPGSLFQCIFMGITLQADGKAVAVGTCAATDNKGHNLVAMRFNTDGSTDNSFGTSGKVITAIRGNTALNVSSLSNGDPQAAAIWALAQTDGKIIVGGWARVPSIAAIAVRSLVVRYLPNGALDTSFGIGGMASTNPSATGNQNYAYASGGALQADGKIVITAPRYVNSVNFDLGNTSVIRLNPNGSFDNTFGAQGYASSTIPFNQGSPKKQIVIPANGAIDISGVQGVDANHLFALLAKVTPLGNFDLSYGTNGTLQVANTTAQAIALFNASPNPFALTGAPCTIVKSMIDQTLGQILWSQRASDGTFTVLCSQPQDFFEYGWITKYRADGSLDVNYSAAVSTLDPTKVVFASALLPDGKVLISAADQGILGTWPLAIGDGVFINLRTLFKRFNADGSLDTNYGGLGQIN